MKKILNLIQNYFSKSKISHQLYQIYILAILIPTVLLGTFLLVYSYNILSGYYQDIIDSDNYRINTILYEVTNQIYNTSEELSSSTELCSILTTDFENSYHFTKTAINYTTVQKYINNYAEIENITIYSDNPTISQYAQFFPVNDIVYQTDWYKKSLNQSSPFWIQTSKTDKYNNTYHCLSLIRKIPLINSPYHATLMISISDNQLSNRITNKNINKNKVSTIISLDDGPIVFSSDRTLYAKPQIVDIDYSNKHYTYSGTVSLNNSYQFASILTLDLTHSDNKLYIVNLSEDAYLSIKKIIIIFLSLIVFAFLTPFLIICFFTQYFSNRIYTLREEMHKASLENYNIIDSLRGNDEISEAFSDLEMMVYKIKEKEAKIYQAQIHQQELKNDQQVMEFKMLASQINPHFLYNTLETIRMKAFTAGNKDVATAIKLLGKSMRYVLENTGTTSTSIKKELDYIDTYLQIQKLRFEDKINYQLIVNDNLDLSSYQILPLLLQPIVENATVHGLKNTENSGYITINVRIYHETHLIIDVHDNGCGIDKETLKSIQQKIQQRDPSIRSSIGLYNINQRIKLCYGEQYGMSILSSPNKGTCVSITIPLMSV